MSDQGEQCTPARVVHCIDHSMAADSLPNAISNVVSICAHVTNTIAGKERDKFICVCMRA